MEREIFVHADWDGLDGPRLMGTLRAIESRGKELFSFAYDERWLAESLSSPLDPDLKFFQGPQYLADADRPNFGLFLDSSPHRWGRLLMRRREAALARREGRDPRPLFQSDYLLGVHDEQRVGALRFQLEAGGSFLSDEIEMAAPRGRRCASWSMRVGKSKTRTPNPTKGC